MDNLEALSDEELRLRLLQYGFPNLPVTVSTRRVLIKKLRNCITKERGKVRNDSSMATSFSSEDDSDTDTSVKRRSRNSSGSNHHQKKDGFAIPSLPVSGSSPSSMGIYGRQSTRNRYSSNVHVSPLIVSDSDEEPESFNGYVKNSSSIMSDDGTARTRYSSGLSSSPAGENTNGYDSPSLADLRKRLMMIRNETINNNRKTLNGPCVSTGQFSSSWTPSTYTRTTISTSAPHPSNQRSIENDIVCHADPIPDTPVTPISVALSNLMNKLDEYYGVKQTFVPCILLSILIGFFVIIAGMYLTISPDIKSALVADSTKFLLCDDSHGINHIPTHDCIEKEALDGTLDFIGKLIVELQDRAILNKCVDTAHPFVMTPRDIITFVLEMDATSHVLSIIRNFHNAQYLIALNPQWHIKNVETSGRPLTLEEAVQLRASENACLAVLEPVLPLTCIVKNKIQKFFVIVGGLALVSGVLYIIRMTYLYVKLKQQTRKDQVNALISDITSAVIKQGMRAKTDPGEDACIVVAHLRDNIIPPAKRKEYEWAWIEAMKYLEANESRISFEVGNRNGEDCKLMRWIDPSTITPYGGTPNTSTQLNNSSDIPFGRSSSSAVPTIKSWQGPAFDKTNKIKDPPTPCLKIRQMFDEYDANDPNLKQVIQDAILAKVGNSCRIYDVQLDTSSCCVYVRCASQQEAGMVHDEINGWWFDNRLVSIKFLRLERYLTRFPQSNQGPACLRPTSLASIQNMVANNNKSGTQMTNGDDDESND
uniref:CSON001752 protein n=1 Tax=Culicoides sonorensis TaxID=179676 RepID=A0A336KGC3_CULSO